MRAAIALLLSLNYSDDFLVIRSLKKSYREAACIDETESLELADSLEYSSLIDFDKCRTNLVGPEEISPRE